MVLTIQNFRKFSLVHVASLCKGFIEILVYVLYTFHLHSFSVPYLLFFTVQSTSGGKRKVPNAEKATDDYHYERFKKQLRRY